MRANKQGLTTIKVAKLTRSGTPSPTSKVASPTSKVVSPSSSMQDVPIFTRKAPTPSVDTLFASPGDGGWTYVGTGEFYVTLVKDEKTALLTPSEFFELNLGSESLEEFYAENPLFLKCYVLRHGDRLVAAFARSNGTWRYGATDRTWLNFTFTNHGVLTRTEHGFCVKMPGQGTEWLDVVRTPKPTKFRASKSSDSCDASATYVL